MAAKNGMTKRKAENLGWKFVQDEPATYDVQGNERVRIREGQCIAEKQVGVNLIRQSAPSMDQLLKVIAADEDDRARRKSPEQIREETLGRETEKDTVEAEANSAADSKDGLVTGDAPPASPGTRRGLITA